LKFEVIQLLENAKMIEDFSFPNRVITTTQTVTMSTAGTDDTDHLRQSMQEIVDKFMTDERQHP
jgi:hypothetical protein